MGKNKGSKNNKNKNKKVVSLDQLGSMFPDSPTETTETVWSPKESKRSMPSLAEIQAEQAVESEKEKAALLKKQQEEKKKKEADDQKRINALRDLIREEKEYWIRNPGKCNPATAMATWEMQKGHQVQAVIFQKYRLMEHPEKGLISGVVMKYKYAPMLVFDYAPFLPYRDEAYRMYKAMGCSVI
jgi:hypothetical protein